MFYLVSSKTFTNNVMSCVWYNSLSTVCAKPNFTRVTSPCPHMQLQHNATHASHDTGAYAMWSFHAVPEHEYILYIFKLHGSNPLILTMLVLRSSDLGPEITPYDTYTYTHSTEYCMVPSHCSFIKITLYNPHTEHRVSMYRSFTLTTWTCTCTNARI